MRNENNLMLVDIQTLKKSLQQAAHGERITDGIEVVELRSKNSALIESLAVEKKRCDYLEKKLSENTRIILDCESNVKYLEDSQV